MALNLSELDGTNGFRLDRAAAYAYSGSSVSAAGDVNGDGIDDLIVGAPFATTAGGTSAGASYVVFGTDVGFAASVDLAALDGSNGVRLDGATTNDESGMSVAGAGDVNGDGIDDLIVGAPQGYSYGIGASFVVFGTDAGFAASLDLAALDGSNGFRLDGAASGDESGASVSAAGDVNGDGIDDLIVGAPGAGSDAGASYVVFGTGADFAASLDLAALDGSDGFRLDGAAADDNSGLSVSDAGDVNGDGIDDLIVGAPGRFYSYGAGASFVVFGTDAGFAATLDLAALDGSDGFRLDGTASGDFSGRSVSAAGDVNGDGIGDLIVGAPQTETAGGYYAGASYVVFGTDAGFAATLDLAALDGSDGFRLDGAAAGDGSGYSVSAAGNFNGDGIDDLIVGAPFADTVGGVAAGASYVVFGSDAGFAASLDLAALDGNGGFRIDGAAAFEQSGASVSGAGDVNGDGIDDLIVGAPTADDQVVGAAGASYVVFGFRTGGTSTTEASVAASPDDAEQHAGAPVQLASNGLEIGSRDHLAGLRFTGLDIPDGATVTGAYIEFEARHSDADASRITIALEASTAATTFGNCADSIAARPYLEATTSWSPEAWVEGGVYRTADLTATIAALIGTEGLDLDEALAFRFSGTGEREAASFESSGAAPKLVITFETGQPEDTSGVQDETAARLSGPMPFADAPADATRFAGDDLRFLGMADDTFSPTVSQDDWLE